jgi:septal ring factor EnvC (AmiA/AmiB activator)
MSFGPNATADPDLDRQKDLDEIRQGIARLEEELERIDSESSGLEAELRRTETDFRLQERQVDEAIAERELAEESLKDSESRIAELEARLDKARRDLTIRLASLYRFSEEKVLQAFLSPGQSADPLDEMRLLRLITRRDAYWIDRFHSSRRDLLAERDRLRERRRELDRTSALEQERLKRLERTRRSQRRALEVIAARRAGVAQRASDLVAKGERLSLLLSILAGRDSPAPGEVAIQSFEGVLDWPLEGEVVEGFGLRSEATYNTKIPHNGIEIAASEDREVRVVFPGVVVFSAPFEDFGMTVVVHHPERVFSLYAGLAALNVAKDDVLSFSDVLGVTAGNLYFEIRVENTPRDPMEWLR